MHPNCKEYFKFNYSFTKNYKTLIGDADDSLVITDTSTFFPDNQKGAIASIEKKDASIKSAKKR